MKPDPIARMTGAVIPTSVDAEFREVLADVVDDLFELAVEFEGLGDEPVVGARQGDCRLGPTGDDDKVVRRETYDHGLDPDLPFHYVGGEDTGCRRGRRGG
jgi:hypothetical protein